jgi:hypothetical protein
VCLSPALTVLAAALFGSLYLLKYKETRVISNENPIKQQVTPLFFSEKRTPEDEELREKDRR